MVDDLSSAYPHDRALKLMRKSLLRWIQFGNFTLFPIALIISLSFILSTGPQVQKYIFSLLNSDMPSIYDSVYREQHVIFPSLRTWISAGLTWPYLVMAFFITVFVVRRTEVKYVFWHGAVCSLVVLTAFDIGLGLYENLLTIKWLVENIAGNFFGGILIAAILVVLLSATDFVYTHTPTELPTRRVIAALSLILGGVFTCCAVYYIADLLYRPLPTKFEAYFAVPTRGAVASLRNIKAPTENSNDENEGRPFSFAPIKPISGNVKWTSGEDMLTVKALSPSEDRKHKVAITPLSGCQTELEITELKSVTPWHTINDVNLLEASFDSGSASFFTMIPDKKKSEIKIERGDVTLFSLDHDVDSQLLKVTQFVGNDASLEVYSLADEQSFVLTAPLLNSIEDQLSRQARTVRLRAGDQTFLFTFEPSEIKSSSEKIICSIPKNIKSKINLKTTSINVNQVSSIAGLLVKISQKERAQDLSLPKLGLQVKGGAGWLSLLRLQPKELENHSLGAAKMFQIQGNITDLMLHSAPSSARPLDTYTAVGDLRVMYADQGKLRVSGLANRVWKDQSRVNLTKWEKLGWEVKSLIILGATSVTAFLWSVIRRRFREEKKFTWIGV